MGGSGGGGASYGAYGDSATYGMNYGSTAGQGMWGASQSSPGDVNISSFESPGQVGFSSVAGPGDEGIGLGWSGGILGSVLGLLGSWALGTLGATLAGPVGGILGAAIGNLGGRSTAEGLTSGAEGNQGSGPGAWGGSDAGGGYGYEAPMPTEIPQSGGALPISNEGIGRSSSYYQSSPDFSSMAGSLIGAKEMNSGYRRLGTEAMLDTGYLGNIYDLQMRLR